MEPCPAFFSKQSPKDVDGPAFGKAFDIGAVRQVFRQRGALEVRELASLVDRFQMTEVTSALDQTVMLNFDLIMVGEVLGWSGMFGLRRSEEAARRLANERFEELAKAEGFMRMSEEALGKLLDASWS
jgi:hypothetical protein